MSEKKLAVLAIIAAITLSISILQSKMSQTKTGSTKQAGAGGLLIQGLDTSSIESIQIKAGDEDFKITKQNGNFIIPSKANYPADLSAINDLITSCLDIKLKNLVTSNPENFSDLGLTDENANSLVRFFDKDDKEMTGVIVGNNSMETRSKFVRQTVKNEAYASNKAPYIRPQMLQYINKIILELEEDDIAKVMIQNPDDTYSIRKNEGEYTYQLDATPEGRTANKYAIQAAYRAGQKIQLTDIATGSVDISGLDFTKYNVITEMDSGMIYTFKYAEKDGKYYMVCDAMFKEELPVFDTSQQHSEDELKAIEAKYLAKDTAAAFSAKHKSWIYEVGKSTFDQISKKSEDLLDKLPEPKEETAETNSNG